MAARAEQEILKLQREAAAQQQQLAAAASSIVAGQLQMEAVQRDRDASVASAEDAMSRVKNLQEEVSKLRAALAEQESACFKATEEGLRLDTEVQTLKHTAEVLQNDRKMLEEQRESGTAEMATLQASLEAVTAERDALLQELQTISVVVGECEALRQEVDDKNLALKEVRAHEHGLELDLKALRCELQTLQVICTCLCIHVYMCVCVLCNCLCAV